MQKRTLGKTGQGDAIQHRGVTLPIGMSPALADALERKLCAWYDEQDQFPFEFGVQLFEEISETRHS